MNKKIVLVAAFTAIGITAAGIGFAYTNNKDSKASEQTAMEKKEETVAMQKTEETAMQKDPASTDEAMKSNEKMTAENKPMEKQEVMTTHGSYITLADYSKDPSAYVDFKKVHFFHASWCPVCQGIDKEINADITKIPKGVVIIKTDFDAATDLRKKYGVTYQYTFVQIDNSGNETAQWSATDLTKALNGIKS